MCISFILYNKIFWSIYWNYYSSEIIWYPPFLGDPMKWISCFFDNSRIILFALPFKGPIYTQIEEAVDFVLRNIRLGATIDGLVRKERYELPPEAIREMIINAHCHRNLLDESCIQVAIYDDRLEVTSPGGLYNGLTYEEVMNGHSKIRNKGIANIFSQMGLVEAWGSGIKRILNAAEEYGLPKPRFQEFDNMFRVELFRNLFPMMEESRNIGEASEKHRRSIGNRTTNRT